MAVSVIFKTTGLSTNGNIATMGISGAAEGDLAVYVASTDAAATGSIAPGNPSGWTELFYDESSGVKLGVWTKVMGPTPDTFVQSSDPGGSTTAFTSMLWVLRGPVAFNAGGVAGSVPPDRNVGSADSAVLIASSKGGLGAPTAPTGWETHYQTVQANDTEPSNISGSVLVGPSVGTIDPPEIDASHEYAVTVVFEAAEIFTGSFIRINDTKYRVRMHDGSAASVRLANGDRFRV